MKTYHVRNSDGQHVGFFTAEQLNACLDKLANGQKWTMSCTGYGHKVFTKWDLIALINEMC